MLKNEVVQTYTDIISLHKEISNIATPKSYIENDRPDGRGNDYAAAHYMRYLLKKYFPTASWVTTDSGIWNKDRLVEWRTSGVLKWDYGIIGYPDRKAEGSMSCSHKVQYKRDDKTKLSELGNDIKASNTDAWKKALNFHLNICDDVYRWEYPELTKSQEKIILDLANQVKDDFSLKVIQHITNQNNQINKENFSKILSGLKIKLTKLNEKDGTNE